MEITAPSVLWRIHRTHGAHVIAWNALRAFGPLPTMRWDPHPLPLGNHPGHAVLYAAEDLTTALAEVFQRTRVIDPVSLTPQVTAWTPTRPLRLLDLTGTWALRNQAASSLASAPRTTCRAWSRGIHETWPDLDGLIVPSTMTGSPCVVLWWPARDSLPERPDFSRPLATPMLRAMATTVAGDIGYGIL